MFPSPMNPTVGLLLLFASTIHAFPLILSTPSAPMRDLRQSQMLVSLRTSPSFVETHSLNPDRL